MEHVYTYDELAPEAQERVMLDDFDSCAGDYIFDAADWALKNCDSLYPDALDRVRAAICDALEVFDRRSSEHIDHTCDYFFSDGTPLELELQDCRYILWAVAPETMNGPDLGYFKMRDELERATGCRDFGEFYYQHQHNNVWHDNEVWLISHSILEWWCLLPDPDDDEE